MLKVGGASRNSPTATAAVTTSSNNHVVWNPKLMKDKLENEDTRKELFVEMCFFARLGYVQPPCCLHCLYQEAIEKSAKPNHNCERWVAFRKDTTIPLHPDFLAENIAFVRCHTVRKLLPGSPTGRGAVVVDEFVFDAKQNRFRKATRNSVGST
jgi:hypothetical protein